MKSVTQELSTPRGQRTESLTNISVNCIQGNQNESSKIEEFYSPTN